MPARVDVALRSFGQPNAVARQFDFWDNSYEWRRLFSELFGTFLLVTVAAGGGMVNARFGGNVVPGPARVVGPALTVMAIILFMGAVSGAHLNPAVSFAFALRGNFPWRRVGPYVVCQFAGAVLATLVLRGLVGQHGSAGLTLPGPGVAGWTALAWEALLTTGLVSVVLGTSSGAQALGPIAAFGVGGYIAAAGLFGAPVSGASMNPVRSLGPALVLGNWTSWWVYLAGPVIGAAIAVGIAHILRGPGGGTAGSRAAQGTLGIVWRPEPIGQPVQAPDRADDPPPAGPAGPSGGPAPAWARPMADRPGATLEAPRPQVRPAERQARGKAIRRAVPRESHAAFEPGRDRQDPVALLQQQGESRVAELLPIRYGRMLASPLAYYRGAALPMAADLARTPATGLIAQLCGDAHLSNFGMFASPERRLVFDINDFDETLPGPWEWDVKRLAVSLELAAQVNGFPARQRGRIVTETVAHYRLAMRRLAGLGNLDVWYSSGDVEALAARYRMVLSRREQALGGTGLDAPDDERRELAGMLRSGPGAPRIAGSPPLVVPAGDLAASDPGLKARLHQVVGGYRQSLEAHQRYLFRQFTVADTARKVAGIGSVGMRCWIVLLTGRDSGDLLFLQLKEAQPSVLSQFAGASQYSSQGERVVAGQRLMQVSSDIFLGWQPASRPAAGRGSQPAGPATGYYVRQLRDWKFSVATADMRPAILLAYGALCGRTLARAHARTADRIAIGAYLGKSAAFESAVAEFAGRYARQNQRDYDALKAAVVAGRLPAQTGV